MIIITNPSFSQANIKTKVKNSFKYPKKIASIPLRK